MAWKDLGAELAAEFVNLAPGPPALEDALFRAYQWRLSQKRAARKLDGAWVRTQHRRYQRESRRRHWVRFLAHKREWTRRKARRKLLQWRRRTDRPTTCAGCGIPWCPARRRVKFCTVECKNRATRAARDLEQHRLDMKARRERDPEGTRAKERARLHRKRVRERIPRVTQCPACGVEFCPLRVDAKYCSARCQCVGRLERNRQRRRKEAGP
jgi:hypothetical protein